MKLRNCGNGWRAQRLPMVRKLAVGMAAVLCLTNAYPAAAQLGPEDKATLRQRGFSPTEIALYDQTRIAPAYEPYRKWTVCLTTALRGLLVQEHSLRDLQALTFQVCDQYKRSAFSVLARQTSAVSADRIFAMADVLYREMIIYNYAAANAQVEGAQTVVRNWRIDAVDNGCVARDAKASGFPQIMAAAYAARPGELEIWFVTGQPLPVEAGSFQKGKIVRLPLGAFIDMAGKDLGVRTFEVSGSSSEVVLTLKLTAADVERFSHFTAYQFSYGHLTLPAVNLGSTFQPLLTCAAAKRAR